MIKFIKSLFLDNPSTKDELEFLPAAQEILETPASPAGRALLFTLCTLFALVIIWAFVGRIDLVAVARGRIIPTERVKEIQPVEKGIVRAIHVFEGKEVKAGDILIELDPTETTSDRDSTASDLMSAKLNLDRLVQLATAIEKPKAEMLEYVPTIVEGTGEQQIQNQKSLFAAGLNGYRSNVQGVMEELNEKRSELNAAEAEIKRLSDTLPLVQERKEKRAELAKQGYSSRMEYLQAEQEFVDIRESLTRQQKSRDAVKHAIDGLSEKLKNTRAEQEIVIRSEIDETRTKIASMEQQLTKYAERTNQTQIPAPIDGTVQQLSISTEGGVVTPAQQLMVIVPKDSGLEVEAFVENKDIGFIEPNQKVAVKIDTFKFTRYGLIDGKVISLSQDAVLREEQQKGLPPTRPEEQQALYKARIKLDKTTMNVDGRKVPLSAGMTVTAEIKTGDQRVIEYILSPILQYADEAMRER